MSDHAKVNVNPNFKAEALKLANRLVIEAPVLREQGEAKLVQRAWDYSNAETAKCNAQRNRAMMIGAGIDYPLPFAEALEHDIARAHAACDAFVSEYESYRGRNTRR